LKYKRFYHLHAKAHKRLFSIGYIQIFENPTTFRLMRKPKGIPIGPLKVLFEFLGLAPGLAIEISQGKRGPVEQLQSKVRIVLE